MKPMTMARARARAALEADMRAARGEFVSHLGNQAYTGLVWRFLAQRTDDYGHAYLLLRTFRLWPRRLLH
jgi:hypothetical protein